MLLRWLTALVATVLYSAQAAAQSPPAAPQEIVFRNVRVFDGVSAVLSAPTTVVVRGNKIAAIGGSSSAAATVIDGGGRTLMPGLIDAHAHIMFSSMSQVAILTGDVGFMTLAAAKEAKATLMRGFTSIRDLGGPSFALKKAIDIGWVDGPRIWPSGAMVSQSGGHGDFRLPNELPAAPGTFGYPERVGATAIVDDEGGIRKRVREQLALGASQIKLMAGGGVSSSFDPLDVTQYSVSEIKAAVEAAENWGTYVTVHAYTPRAVQQAIAAGVKCIDHGQLLDDATAKMMADKGIWWSLQPFTDDGPSAFPDGSPNRIKQLAMFSGTDAAYAKARKFGIKTAWGTDVLFSATSAARQGHLLAKMTKWFTPAEALTMATSTNAELLSLSGLRSPYPGKLGSVSVDALADLILVDGDPTKDLSLVADAEKNFLVIMKDGKIYKNTLTR